MWVVAPSALALLLVWGAWKYVIRAVIVWWGLLILVFCVFTGDPEEGFGWALIMGMFYSIAGIPILASSFKLFAYLHKTIDNVRTKLEAAS